MTSYVMYGIKNCDTIKKARSFFEQCQIPVKFHDYRVDGIPLEVLRQAMQQHGWQTLINQRGTTWRGLSDTDKQIDNLEAALTLVQLHPAVIKRPLLQRGDQFLIGFDANNYQQFCL